MNPNENYEAARKLMNEGKYEEAVAMFEHDVKADPHFKDLELLGECLMRLDKLVEAIVPLAAATTLNKSVRAPSLLAEVYSRLGETNDAKAIAELALSRDPNNRKALKIIKKTSQTHNHLHNRVPHHRAYGSVHGGPAQTRDKPA